MKNLKERAMLVNLSASSWSGRTKDNGVSQEVIDNKGADQDAGTWWTYLLPKKHTTAISSAIGRCRAVHAKYTLPWMDGGLRILPSDMFLEYSKAVRDAKNNFQKVVDEFIADYPNIVADATKRLGKLQMGKHFPSVETVRSRFGIYTDILPIPDAGDFRVQMDNSEVNVDEIRTNITESINKSLQGAMSSLWSQLEELVTKVQNTLSEPDKIFRDSLIENLAEFCQRIPKMNLTEDEELEKIRKEILDKLSDVRPDDLREEPDTRKKTADAAKDVLEKMRSYFGK